MHRQRFRTLGLALAVVLTTVMLAAIDVLARPDLEAAATPQDSALVTGDLTSEIEA